MSAGADRSVIEACLVKGVPFWWRGPGAILIQTPGAEKVIDELERNGRRVLGVEAFDVQPDIHPRIDLIFDFSRSPAKSAARAVADWDPQTWVEVTLAN